MCSKATTKNSDSSGDLVIKELEKSLLDLESKLTPLIMDSKVKGTIRVTEDKNSQSDLENSRNNVILKGVRTYVLISSYLMAILTSRTFRSSFKTKISVNLQTEDVKDLNEYMVLFNEIKSPSLSDIKTKKITNILLELRKKTLNELTGMIESFDYMPNNRNSIKPLPQVNRESLSNLQLWQPILERASKFMNSIIYHVWAVELISKSNGATTPGIDGVSFKKLPTIYVTKDKDRALRYLDDRITSKTNIIS